MSTPTKASSICKGNCQNRDRANWANSSRHMRFMVRVAPFCRGSRRGFSPGT